MNNLFQTKKVSNLEMQHSLKETLQKNTRAIDYIQECINKCQDILKYNENDFQVKDELENLEYIQFTLYYLDKQYMKSYKKVGGKL